MKKMLQGTVIALTAAAAIGVPALALAHGGRWGQLTPEERQERKAELLAKYDTDKDGHLSDAERDAARKDFLTQRFQELDTNKDGVISMAEFMAGHPRRGQR